MLSDYEGCKILAVRFPLYKKLGNVKAFVANTSEMQSDYTYNVGEYLASQDGTANKVITISNNDITAMNYNTITFDTPYTIPSNPQDLVVGMEYTQKSTQSGGSYTDDCYNFCAVRLPLTVDLLPMEISIPTRPRRLGSCCIERRHKQHVG